MLHWRETGHQPLEMHRHVGTSLFPGPTLERKTHIQVNTYRGLRHSVRHHPLGVKAIIPGEERSRFLEGCAGGCVGSLGGGGHSPQREWSYKWFGPVEA